MKSASSPPVGKEEGAWRFLLSIWFTVVFFALEAGLLAAVICKLVPPLVLDETFLEKFTVYKGYFFTGQPPKNAAFEITCLAAPFLLLGSYFLAGKVLSHLRDSVLPVAAKTAVGVTWLFFFSCLFPITYCPMPPLEGMPPDWFVYKWFFITAPFFTPMRLLVVVIGAGIYAFFFRCSSSSKNLNRAFAVIIFIAILIIPTRFYVPVAINDSWRFSSHLSPIIYGLSQVGEGKHLLVNFPHVYGGYIEFVAPIIALFPRRVETILIILGLLNLSAIACLLVANRLLLLSPLHLLLSGCGTLAILCIGTGDIYYQYSAVRLLFPAAGLLAAVHFLRRPSPLSYGATSLLAAIAPFWNLDTGVVLWISWTAMLVVREGTEHASLLRAMRQLAAQGLILLAVATAFFLYLRIVSGHWPDPTMLFVFQKIYFASGYFGVALLVPDMWIFVLAIYITGLTVALIFYLRKAFTWRTHAMLLISLMGVGIFSYFIGRSAECNVVTTAYFVPLLLGLFSSEASRLVETQQMPRLIRAFLIPFTLIQIWWALLLVLALPNLVTLSAEKFRMWAETDATPFSRDAAFIQRETKPKESIYILSGQGGFYYYLSDTTCSLDLPSPIELLLTRDMDQLISSIESESLPSLFVGRDFSELGMYRTDIYQRIDQAIRQHYRPVASSEDGRVIHYVPR